MTVIGTYEEALQRFADQPVVTIAAGATCAYLGDERNLREFLVADETARRLRRAGNTVFFLLIDDSLDPLNFRQLRVAVHKDPELLEEFKHWCGKPIAQVPDPWGCHDSYACHFEEELLGRLHHLGCHPTLITTAHLYERGMYAPYVRLVLERYDEILRFLQTRFEGYRPDKLFWVLCPNCRYIDETEIGSIKGGCVYAHCHRCRRAMVIPFDELQGKLNWKLDCAVRWALFNIDAEPFSKAYLEPQTGTYQIAQALSRQFFGGQEVLPLHYGLVKMDKQFSYKLLESLPSGALRDLLVKRPSADITLTRDLVVTAASRHEVLPGLSYLDFVKQLLPMWLLDASAPEQRELVTHGVAFAKHFLDSEVCLHLPAREHFEGEHFPVLGAVHTLLRQVIGLRRAACPSWEAFRESVKQLVDSLGGNKKAALHRLRRIVGQEQGLPVARFLFLLPLGYLQMLEYMLDLHLGGSRPGIGRQIGPLAAEELVLASGYIST